MDGLIGKLAKDNGAWVRVQRYQWRVRRLEQRFVLGVNNRGLEGGVIKISFVHVEEDGGGVGGSAKLHQDEPDQRDWRRMRRLVRGGIEELKSAQQYVYG